MRLTNNTIHSISKSSNIRMGLSYAKESHAEFFNRFSLCQDRIKDIFEIEKGTSITEAQAVEGNIPVVAGGKDYAYLHNESNRPQGCITISASGANSGFVNYWDVPIWASDCVTLKSKDEDKYLTKFLYYALRLIQSDIYLLQKGSDQPHVYASDIQYIKVPAVSVPIQKKALAEAHAIEKEIETIESSIKKNGEIIDDVFNREFRFAMDEFNRTKQAKRFSANYRTLSNNADLRFSAKFHRDSGNFVMQELMNRTDKKIKHYLAEPIVLGASVSPSDYSDNGEFCYISMATIKNWKFDLESASTVSKEYSDSKQAKTVRKNDIILARSGEGTIGKVALIDDDELQGVFADFTMRIRLKDYNPEFAYYYFRTTYFQYLIEIYKKGLGNNTNIFPIVVREFPMLDISLEEQQRIVDKIHAEIAKQDEIKKQIESLRGQIDVMIQDVLTQNQG